MRWKISITLVVLVLVALGSFGYYRVKQNQELEEGVVAFKQGRYAEALVALQPLAREGNSTAQELVGMAYAFGHGISRDRRIAREMLAAASGQKAGAVFLYVSEEFEQGKNVGRDEQEARYWLQAAADAGDERAKARVSAMTKK